MRLVAVVGALGQFRLMTAPTPVPGLSDAALIVQYTPATSTGPCAINFALFGDSHRHGAARRDAQFVAGRRHVALAKIQQEQAHMATSNGAFTLTVNTNAGFGETSKPHIENQVLRDLLLHGAGMSHAGR
jgi:hypothetical protein